MKIFKNLKILWNLFSSEHFVPYILNTYADSRLSLFFALLKSSEPKIHKTVKKIICVRICVGFISFIISLNRK